MIEIAKKLIRDPHRAIKTLKYYSGRVFGNYEYKKFIVLSRNRTGSNLLISMLNSHPSVYAKYEILRKLNGVSIVNILNSIYARCPHSIEAVGFKIFYHHPVDDKSDYVWKLLVNMDDLHVIHLKRRNMLRTIVSREIAQKSKTWLRNKNSEYIDIKEKKVHLDVEKLIAAFRQTREWETFYAQMFNFHPYLDIYYEDLVKQPQIEYQKIMKLLDLEFYNPKTCFQKQNPEKLSDLISNYEFIKRRIVKTEWSYFLEN